MTGFQRRKLKWKKAMCLIFLALYTPKKKSDDDYMRENLYNMKLQCPAEVLSKRSLLDVVGAEQDAKAINAAFDKITF
ncbi:hypothetical protein [Escherichia coli]|uniref:hypothetical protein n=1 Tax=Escherichia coli TaxID=562 RepID=UPI00388D3C5D